MKVGSIHPTYSRGFAAKRNRCQLFMVGLFLPRASFFFFNIGQMPDLGTFAPRLGHKASVLSHRRLFRLSEFCCSALYTVRDLHCTLHQSLSLFLMTIVGRLRSSLGRTDSFSYDPSMSLLSKFVPSNLLFFFFFFDRIGLSL